MNLTDYLVAIFLFLLAMLAASCARDRTTVYCTNVYSPVCYEGTLYVNECFAMKEGIDNKDLTKAECVLNTAGCECN